MTSVAIMALDKTNHSRQIGRLSRLITRLRQVVLMAPGAIMIQLTPALALDGSDAGAQKSAPKSFTSGQEALRVGEEDLRAGNMEASVAALTYAAESGQAIARWKLGQMYADGDGVPSDASKAYYYLNKLVADYDEDQPDRQDESAVSDAFVAVGVYCLNGIPNSAVRSDPQRAQELFQYAATRFADPNAQYNLAHMYMIGAGGLAKDNIAAIRWLALAAKQGHSPSQALLGHMLFVGNVVMDQRARGLMWLELAKDGASNPKDQWIRDLYQRDFRVARDDERLAAASMLEARVRGTSHPLPARSSVASSLEPFSSLPADQ
jgi:exopolysaccharide production negative regulator